MITDEKRREVAEDLRELDVSDLGGEGNVIDTLLESGALLELMLNAANDCRPGLHYAMSHYRARDAVELFADLIDRETCHNVSGYKDVFKCSECRCKVEIVGENGNEYGEVFNTPPIPSFCPGCGRKAVDE